MSRKTARDAALRLLFARALGGDGDMDTVTDLMDCGEPQVEDRRFITDILEGVNLHLAEIDEKINDLAIGWPIERMARIDLSTLRLGAYEILYRRDIPGSVTVNECVELAKTYSGAEAGPFVNGILGNLLRSLPFEET